MTLPYVGHLQGAPATLLTDSKKRVKSVSIFLRGDDEQEDERRSQANKSKVEEVLGRGDRNVLASKTRVSRTLDIFNLHVLLFAVTGYGTFTHN